jgi:predicted dehydrogenase
LHGTAITVEVPTHVSAVVDMASGPVATVVTSFDIHASELPRMEIYGTEGTLSVPDPNTFGGPVRVRRAGDSEWRAIPLRPGYSEQSRGIGVADMVAAARHGRPHRASGELALHVLDIMQAVHEASDQGAAVTLTTTCERPQPFS